MSDATVLPTTSQERKDVPLARGVLDYFPAALAAIASLSKAGNDKHNPGEEMHHARGKSTDHADCILRHLVDRGTIDEEDGILHDVKVAWRALAMLQEALEQRGAPLARGARLPSQVCPNDVNNRIGGETHAMRDIKARYYEGLRVGLRVEHRPSGYKGTIVDGSIPEKVNVKYTHDHDYTPVDEEWTEYECVYDLRVL